MLAVPKALTVVSNIDKGSGHLTGEFRVWLKHPSEFGIRNGVKPPRSVGGVDELQDKFQHQQGANAGANHQQQIAKQFSHVSQLESIERKIETIADACD